MESVAEHLLSEPIESVYESLAEQFGLNDIQIDAVRSTVEDLAAGAVLPEDFPSALFTQADVPDDKLKPLAVQLLGRVLLPVDSALEFAVTDEISALGGDPSMFSQTARVDISVPLVDAIAPVESKKKDEQRAAFSDPVLQHRLELIVASYRDGVRTREQAVSVMMRPIKTGGLEMKEGEAGDVLALVGEMDTKLRNGYETTKLRMDTEIATKQGGAKADGFTKEDEEEIKKIAETKKEAMEQPVLIADTKVAADRIGSDAGVSFATGELRTRFDHIIDARLRDVRDGFETRAKLEALPEQGGVGLAGAQLVAVMETVEQMDAMHHKALAAEMAGKKEAHVAQKAHEAEGVAAQEEQVMAKRYAEITGKAPQQIVTPTPSRTTVAVPAAELIKAREQNIDTGKVKAAIEAAKAVAPTVTPVFSEPSIPQATSGRPKVEDIRFERKLSGPVEELRLLTLTDFRRLSKDPKQAILRVQDKVEIAAHEGYDRRIAATRAWRESPLCQAYLALSREALMGGKGVVQILAEKRAAGQDVPTDEELHAIVELNGILRF